MKLLVLALIIVAISGCTQSQANVKNNIKEIQNQTEEPLDQAAEVSFPIQVVQSKKTNFSAVSHPMNIENPLWKMPVKYKLVNEPGMDEYRLNITLKAVSEAIKELENLTNNSLKFERADSDYGLLIEINSSLKHIDSKALGISLIKGYIPQQDYNEITKARIALTPIYSCAAKIEAMHELLHILGFGHSNETNSIMYA